MTANWGRIIKIPTNGLKTLRFKKKEETLSGSLLNVRKSKMAAAEYSKKNEKN